MFCAFSLRPTPEDLADSLREGPLRTVCREVLKSLNKDSPVRKEGDTESVLSGNAATPKPPVTLKAPTSLTSFMKRKLKRQKINVINKSDFNASDKYQKLGDSQNIDRQKTNPEWSDTASTATQGSLRSRITSDRPPALRYNRLACPKNQKVKDCYVCGKNARFQCRICRSSFYCSQAHYEHDGNHVFLCDNLRDLQNVQKESEENSDPFRREILAKTLLDKQKDCLEKIYYSSIYCLANNKMTTAKYSLEHSIEWVKALKAPEYGVGSKKLLELLLLLSMASCRVGDAKAAGQQISLAEVVLEHSPHLIEVESTRADLSLCWGLQCMVAGQAGDAKYYLSDSLYHRLSQGDVSPLSVRCLMSLGEIAEWEGDALMARSFYEHCLMDYLTVLYKFLNEVLNPPKKEFTIAKEKFAFSPLAIPVMIEAECATGLQKITKIFTKDDKKYRKAVFALAIMCFIKGDFPTSASLFNNCKAHLKRDSRISKYISSMSQVIRGSSWKQQGFKSVAKAQVSTKTKKLSSIVPTNEQQLNILRDRLREQLPEASSPHGRDTHKSKQKRRASRFYE